MIINNETWHWDIKGQDDRDMPRLLSSTGEEICNFGNCTTYYPTEGSPPMPHHMALIAAAPELLEALEALVSHLQTVDETCDFVFAYKDALAAIAKATGAENGD